MASINYTSRASASCDPDSNSGQASGAGFRVVWGRPAGAHCGVPVLRPGGDGGVHARRRAQNAAHEPGRVGAAVPGDGRLPCPDGALRRHRRIVPRLPADMAEAGALADGLLGQLRAAARSSRDALFLKSPPLRASASGLCRTPSTLPYKIMTRVGCGGMAPGAPC
eukprot:364586-Chlamydomonas_euryale.AAC.13